MQPKILLVDDEPGVLQALQRVLKDDFTVLTAENGHQALDLLQSHTDVAVVLSDFRMPGLSGIDLLKQVRALAPYAVRAILSGQIEMNQIADAINSAEIHKFLLKPWENNHLKLQMLEALQMHGTLSEKAHLHHLSITDPVTHLTNHRFFQDQLRLDLAEAEKTGKPLSLLMVDVDHFKSFNDRYGHPEGDRLLVEIAQRIQKHAGTRGSASRYGGEEFALIYPRLDQKAALTEAEGLRLGIERGTHIGPSGSPAYITVSVGVATYPLHGRTPSELIASADRALYQAKRQGRNQVVASLS